MTISQQTLDVLANAPQPNQDRETFNTNGYAWAAKLYTLGLEINQTVSSLNNVPTSAQSTTSMIVGTGTKTFVTDTNKGYQKGMTIKCAADIAPTHWWKGDVLSYDPVTGNISAEVSSTQNPGATAYTAWTISLDISGTSINPTDIQNQAYTGYNASGTGTAYTITPTPAISAYAANQSFFVTFNVASGAAPTLQISGVATPPNLVKQMVDGSFVNIAANDIPSNHRSRVTLLSATQALVEKLPPAKSEDYIYIREEQASGTNGGTFTSGAWRKRVLNTKVNDAASLAVIASDVITLQPGTYRFKAFAPAQVVGSHRLKLINTTDSIEYLGSSSFTTAGAGIVTDATVEGRFTITAAKTFELQHRATTSRSTDGFGQAAAFGVPEIYSRIEFWKEKV